MEHNLEQESLVFGLDIGTRSVVGTVGYLRGQEFVVIAHYSIEHETRAMIDGQIHDIHRVGATILRVKEELEKQISMELTMVCIAAAGRVLQTVTTNIEVEFEEEKQVTEEDVHTLDLLGIDKAQSLLKEQNDTKYKYYCVGYSCVRFYMEGERIARLEGHKTKQIAEDIIVTFLPEAVVDGLYAAVDLAGLKVANLTLEPIAAIDVAIPENYRMLNIAMVDVGAGTSDISITKEGSIIAYGMIPLAGDEITELIVQHYLVDFQTAEMIKRLSTEDNEIIYTDIMSIEHTITSQEVWDLTLPMVEQITTDVADKIKELNGDGQVSATFVVGGGGKIHGFTEKLAEKLDLMQERVALRGEEVLTNVIFENQDVKKDPLLVTPIGICLNYFERHNNFIMVTFNGEKIKLYDNNKLTVVDAALGAGFPNEHLFPKKGKEIKYLLNGLSKVVHAEAGESAQVFLNDKPASINSPLLPNCTVEVKNSTEGTKGKLTVRDLEEYTKGNLTFLVNQKRIHCPKFVDINGQIQWSDYLIQENDRIETRNYYTVNQVADFMDMTIDENYEILVNNRPAQGNSLVYDNFTLDWVANPKETILDSFKVEDIETEIETEIETDKETDKETEIDTNIEADKETQIDTNIEADKETEIEEINRIENASIVEVEKVSEETKESHQVSTDDKKEYRKPFDLEVIVNGETIAMTGKEVYIFVDVFNYFDFDLSSGEGREIITEINGAKAMFTQELKQKDCISIYWKENVYDGIM